MLSQTDRGFVQGMTMRNCDRDFLSSWVPTLLSSVRSLTTAHLDVEILPFLPAISLKALKKLYLDACIRDAEAVPNLVQAVKECQQLEELRVACHPAYSKGWYLPELDLRHLKHLRQCILIDLPAPGSFSLSHSDIDLYIQVGQCAAWSRLWHGVQSCGRCLTIGHDPQLNSSRAPPCGGGCPEVLRTWPEGIEAFQGLNFLDMTCETLRPLGEDTLDLAHLAFIPHVRLRSNYGLFLRISKGCWNVLDIDSAGAFHLAIDNVQAFVRSTGSYLFSNNALLRQTDLVEKLESAHTGLQTQLYKDSKISPMYNHRITRLSNHELA